MPLYARSDVISVQSANCPIVHTKKKGADFLELDCPECQSSLGGQKALFATQKHMVPLTEEEQAAQEQEDRDIALALAAEGRAIRSQATDRVRKARAQKAQAAEKSARRRVVR